MRSMTGYGRGSVERDGRQMTVELRAVNHRYLDLSFRMPRMLNFLEDTARKRISGAMARGHVDAYITYKNLREDSKAVLVDIALLNAYERALDEMAKTARCADDRTLMEYAKLHDVLTISEVDEDADALTEILVAAMDEALSQLNAMRENEGDAMARDVEARLVALEQIASVVEERQPDTVSEYAARLRVRMEELLGNTSVDEGRLLQEVALMADRSAVAEEIVRLRSHIAQMQEMLKSDEPVGRKLDFLVQELNREANTISSKSQDVPITRLAVDAKAEIEKIREQVQNVE